MSPSCRLQFTLAVGLTAFLPISIAAQTLTTDEKARSLQQRVFDPSMNSPTASPSVQVSLTGTRDSGTVKGRLGVQVGDLVLDLKLSGPIAENAKRASLVDINGLANKAAADFGLTWVRWNPTADPTAQRQACVDYLISSGAAKTESDAKQRLTDKNADGELQHPCTWLSLPATSKFRDQFDRAIVWGTPLLFSTRFKVGREQYNFARPPNYADEQAAHTSYAVNAALGVIIDRIGLIQVANQYQSTYEGKDQSNICSPLDASTSLGCRDIAVGAPDKVVRNLLQLEVRKFFGAPFGVNPQLSYDIKHDVWGAQVPLYFFQSKEGGLNGGVSAGWRSDKQEFTVSVFMGELFTLLPSK